MSETKAPQLLRTRDQLRQWRSAQVGTVGLVMTMGALHEGHLDLVRALQGRAEVVVVSIFVNPTQFAPGEDFDAYPRTLEADIEKLAVLGVDAVFAPEAAELYPPDQTPQVAVDPGPVARILEGKTRPTHFAGVCQVVAKVFHLTSPQLAAFGEKDAQQLAIISQMVRDLDFPLEIVPVPIRREEDGLAMSSRNRYLDTEQRQRALALWRSLQWGRGQAGSLPPSELVRQVKQKLEKGVDQVDYVAMVSQSQYEPVGDDFHGPVVLALAAKVGTTRLIDNIRFTI